VNQRQRMLAVIRGEPLDQVPFVQYDSMCAPNEVIWGALGANNMGVLRWTTVHRVEHPHCQLITEEALIDGKPGWRDTLVTPAGTLTQERTRVSGLGVSAYTKHFVESMDDYAVVRAYLRDGIVLADLEPTVRAHRELGEHGLPHVALTRTPYQQMWVQWVAITDFCLHLADDTGIVRECMELMGQEVLRIAEVAREASRQTLIPYIDMPDNITAGPIGPRQYRQWCLPYYIQIADMLADVDVKVYVHMDGNLKALWPALDEWPPHGIDSLAPPPDNDTRVADVVARWPDTRILVNFPSSVHLADDATIYSQAMELLEEGGHTGRLQIQVSEDPPPERWRVSFPAIVRAVNDFGRP
jgi:hypothetical protein